MKLSVSVLKNHTPCTCGLKWYIDHGEPKTVENTVAALIADKAENNNLSWANWLIARMLKRKDKIRYAIFAAEQVINIYEKKYPDDERPRNAISAAKAVLKKNNVKTRAAGAAAGAAARDAARAAGAAAWDAARAAGAAAWAAAWAARAAAWDAAWAARAAAWDAARAAGDAAGDAARAAGAAAGDAARAAGAAARDAMLIKIINYGLSLIKGGVR
jgi:hypothetical protein